MKWPPSKAWTSVKAIYGFNHFVAINYEYLGKSRLVTLVSVIEREIIFKIDFTELEDSSKWLKGWHDLDSNQLTCKKFESINSELKYETDLEVPIQISEDAGLTIPLNKKKYRPWC